MPGDDAAAVRAEISEFLRFAVPDGCPPLACHETLEDDGYRRSLVTYQAGDGDVIPAYLLVPDGPGPFPAVVVHHQHNGERHLGKSEACGLAGDPLQAFAPALARRGLVVLAPDSICFEDRRRQRAGRDPDPRPGADWLQHFNEMAFRLVSGDLLMRKVLSDAATAVSVLVALDAVDDRRIGTLGHSYGGNTVLFLDKMANGTGIEEAEVIPGFVLRWDISDLVACTAPRPLLLVSATEDPYSRDAPEVEARAAGRTRPGMPPAPSSISDSRDRTRSPRHGSSRSWPGSPLALGRAMLARHRLGRRHWRERGKFSPAAVSPP